jgi:hypothetical protein
VLPAQAAPQHVRRHPEAEAQVEVVAAGRALGDHGDDQLAEVRVDVEHDARAADVRDRSGSKYPPLRVSH